ncbi:MAG: zinc-ribbon domain-containing protein [Acidimicrobiales bacterium]
MAVCQNCGVEAADGAAYCGSCGAPQGQSYQAGFEQYPQAGYPGAGQPYAQGYGPVPVAPPKSKTAAILLAVFLSPWTWLYTYQRDSSKFWIGLGVDVVCWVLGWFFLLPWLALFGVWIWAIVDTATKPEQYYLRYPAG